MKILVIDQCSKAKNIEGDGNPYTVEEINSNTLDELRNESQTPKLRARKLYAGRQQQYINKAVDTLRESGDTVDRFFISAGFGLVDETELLPLYDVTFATFSRKEIEERANELGIQTDLMEVLGGDYDLIFLALGQDYYASIDLAEVLDGVGSDTLVICFNHESQTKDLENAISLPARTEDAKDMGTITVALKGRYLQNFANHRAHGREISNTTDILESCTTPVTEQTDLDDSNF